jgi:hypothetical protein
MHEHVDEPPGSGEPTYAAVPTTEPLTFSHQQPVSSSPAWHDTWEPPPVKLSDVAFVGLDRMTHWSEGVFMTPAAMLAAVTHPEQLTPPAVVALSALTA